MASRTIYLHFRRKPSSAVTTVDEFGAPVRHDARWVKCAECETGWLYGPMRTASTKKLRLSKREKQAYEFLRKNGAHLAEEVGDNFGWGHQTYSAIMSRLRNRFDLIEYLVGEDGEPVMGKTRRKKEAHYYIVKENV